MSINNHSCLLSFFVPLMCLHQIWLNVGSIINGFSSLIFIIGDSNKHVKETKSMCILLYSYGSSDHLNIFSNRPPPKKKRKSRTAFTNTQIFELERKFIQQRYLSPADRDDLASRLGLTGPQVITWFQNRRAKQKREVEETKNDLQNHVKTMYYPDIYDNIQDLSMLKVPDIRASLQFHSKSP